MDTSPEPMSIAEFEALPPRGYRKSEQRQIVDAMAPGDALQIDHGKVMHHSDKNCGWHPMVWRIGKERGVRFKMRHLPDGRVAVACYAKEGTDNVA